MYVCFYATCHYITGYVYLQTYVQRDFQEMLENGCCMREAMTIRTGCWGRVRASNIPGFLCRQSKNAKTLLLGNLSDFHIHFGSVAAERFAHRDLRPPALSHPLPSVSISIAPIPVQKRPPQPAASLFPFFIIQSHAVHMFCILFYFYSDARNKYTALCPFL